MRYSCDWQVGSLLVDALKASTELQSRVIPSGGRSPESKDLRTDLTADVTASAQILRLASLVQDDTPVGAV